MIQNLFDLCEVLFNWVYFNGEIVLVLNFEKHIKYATYECKKCGCRMILFFDAINTCHEIGTFKEIICSDNETQHKSWNKLQYFN